MVTLFLWESHYDARHAKQLKARLRALEANLCSRSDLQKNVQTASGGTPEPMKIDVVPRVCVHAAKKMRRAPGAGKNNRGDECEKNRIWEALWSRCPPLLFSSLGGMRAGTRTVSGIASEGSGKGTCEISVCAESEVSQSWTSLAQWCDARAELLRGECALEEGLRALDDWCAQRDMIESQRASWHKLRQAQRDPNPKQTNGDGESEACWLFQGQASSGVQSP
eukprot:4424340-Amphidinium_carterae.2